MKTNNIIWEHGKYEYHGRAAHYGGRKIFTILLTVNGYTTYINTCSGASVSLGTVLSLDEAKALADKYYDTIGLTRSESLD